MQFTISVAAAMAMFASGALAQARIIMEEMMVPASDAGIEIYVRNKRPVDMASFRPERTLLYVHGSTYPAETAFDLPLGGMSWMEYIAGRGYDVYLLDLRGYGRSTRPAEMSEKPEANAPIVRTDTAVKDVLSAVDFILKRRNIARLNLLGWSWETCRQGRAPHSLRAAMAARDGEPDPDRYRSAACLSHCAQGSGA